MFSLSASWSLAVVALSGLERATQLLGGWGHPPRTSFGRTLDVKLGLFAVLVALGAVNRRRLVSALAGDNGRLSSLRRTVRGEVAAAGGVLLAAALLSELPPGTDAAGGAAAAPPRPRSRPAARLRHHRACHPPGEAWPPDQPLHRPGSRLRHRQVADHRPRPAERPAAGPPRRGDCAARPDPR